MRRVVALALLACTIAVAAPVPKTVPLLGEFGRPTEPKGKCVCELGEGGALTLTVPTDSPAVKFDGQTAIPPVVAKTVEGDFTLTVRMTHKLPIVPSQGRNGPMRGVGSGIALLDEVGGEVGMLGVVQRYRTDDDDWFTSTGLNYHQPKQAPTGGSGVGVTKYTSDQAVYLRVTRRGPKILFETSGDRKGWAELHSEEMNDLGKSVLIGPIVFQRGNLDFAATFDQYEIKPLKEEKK